MRTFGINGFGRIGRISFRIWWKLHKDQADLRVINTSGSMPIGDWVHLIKYDSNYGIFDQPISYEEHQSNDKVTDEDPVLGTIRVGEKQIVMTAQKDPAKIPWGKYGVRTVIEATGHFTTAKKAEAHLQAGAQKVIMTAPPKGGNVFTTVLGVKKAPDHAQVLSNGSCTTNCVAPIAQVMSLAFGVQKAALTTIHSYTDDQNLQDNSHRDMRRARAAMNIVPTTTGAAVSATEVVPELKGLFDGLSMRVPTPVGSLSDMVFLLKKRTTVEQVNAVLTAASHDPRWKGIIAVTNEALVSHDIIGRPESSIVDLSLTQVIDGDLVKVISWYDNEWGYCQRLVEQVCLIL